MVSHYTGSTYNDVFKLFLPDRLISGGEQKGERNVRRRERKEKGGMNDVVTKLSGKVTLYVTDQVMSQYVSCGQRQLSQGTGDSTRERWRERQAV